MEQRKLLEIERIRFSDIVNGKYDLYKPDEQNAAILRPRAQPIALPSSGNPYFPPRYPLPLSQQAFSYQVPHDNCYPNSVQKSVAVPLFSGHAQVQYSALLSGGRPCVVVPVFRY